MNRWIRLVAGLWCFLALVGCAGPKMNLAGNWTSSEGGAMTIHQNGSEIRGTYTLKDGVITGTLSGHTVKGYWIQNHSGRRCAESRNNSYYWGTMQFVFTQNDYTGTWGYCDDRPTNPWTGRRR
ncbi:MAG TPA: hypothetical protein P5208_04910 [Smithellaceae bacterium]|nr:hypothetical protein [Smithellaceae bacterium]HRV44624.1 hypothetical protein [Smithellaceae bacterium]